MSEYIEASSATIPRHLGVSAHPLNGLPQRTTRSRRATRRLNIGVNTYSRPASDSIFSGSTYENIKRCFQPSLPSLPSLTVSQLSCPQLQTSRRGSSQSTLQCALTHTVTNALGNLLHVAFKAFLNITSSMTHLSAPPPGSSTASTPQRSSNTPEPSTGPVSDFIHVRRKPSCRVR